mgnify:CR=1 FL=1
MPEIARDRCVGGGSEMGMERARPTGYLGGYHTILGAPTDRARHQLAQ